MTEDLPELMTGVCVRVLAPYDSDPAWHLSGAIRIMNEICDSGHSCLEAVGVPYWPRGEGPLCIVTAYQGGWGFLWALFDLEPRSQPALIGCGMAGAEVEIPNPTRSSGADAVCILLVRMTRLPCTIADLAEGLAELAIRQGPVPIRRGWEWDLDLLHSRLDSAGAPDPYEPTKPTSTRTGMN